MPRILAPGIREIAHLTAITLIEPPRQKLQILEGRWRRDSHKVKAYFKGALFYDVGRKHEGSC